MNLTKEEFEERANIREKYERFHEEYGDACGFYSDYLDAHYDDYLKGYGYLHLHTELPHD